MTLTVFSMMSIIAPPPQTQGVDLEHDLVVAAPPTPLDIERARSRPAASCPIGTFRCRVEVGCYSVVSEDDLLLPTDTGDLDRNRPSARRRQVQPDAVPADDGLGPAVSMNRFECH